uniref:Uncharacterized protein n=1 Tax=Chenopodium quinoa TaxID=63459 RepID=A0A803NCG4_CHEQI
MASTPGIFSHWPWEPLGNFKYVLVAPGIIHSIYLYLARSDERNPFYLFVFFCMLWRMLHQKLWISLSRYRTAKGNNLIVDRSIDFEQVDRESKWDDQILFNGILFYISYWVLEDAKNMPLWRMDGLLLVFIIHIGPVEFLYYWLHRALHHHFLYSRYHSHHHSSIVSQPHTAVIHPFAEHIAYYFILGLPLMVTTFMGTISIATVALYLTYIDFMNSMGHCNFEFTPKWVFDMIPPLKYLMYTPSYHSMHHTRFRTNYSLFMPFYDYIYGTMDESTDIVYESSLKKPEDVPDVVHLTHLTTLQSVYHLRLGFASLASNPLNSKWYMWLIWPLTCWYALIAWAYGRTFIIERNTFKKLKAKLWIVPCFKKEEEEFNRNGKIYLEKHPKLKVKVVDGSSLVVAVVLNSIPVGTSQVMFRGRLSKVACSIVSALCHKGIQVSTIRNIEYEKLKKSLTTEDGSNLALITNGFNQKVWLVGEDLTKDEQSMASKGTIFVPFSQFPPKKIRNDCFYLNTPSLVAPKSFGNLHSCENWLPRSVISARRVAGIVHALEGWNVNECGDEIFDVEKIWEASLQHGFLPSKTFA